MGTMLWGGGVALQKPTGEWACAALFPPPTVSEADVRVSLGRNVTHSPGCTVPIRTTIEGIKLETKWFKEVLLTEDSSEIDLSSMVVLDTKSPVLQNADKVVYIPAEWSEKPTGDLALTIWGSSGALRPA